MKSSFRPTLKTCAVEAMFMEQPLTEHWQSEAGYYTVLLTPDLFGGWVLITASGKRGERSGRVRHKAVASHAAGLETARRIRRRLRREGYVLCGSGFMEMNDLDPRGRQARNAGARAVFRVFRVWRLERAEEAALLNVEARALDAFRDSGMLADDPEVLRRSHHVLAIHKALRTLQGGETRCAADWLRKPHPRFAASCPLEVMLSGQEGLKVVRRYLESELDLRGRNCAPRHERCLPAPVADTQPAYESA